MYIVTVGKSTQTTWTWCFVKARHTDVHSNSRQVYTNRMEFCQSTAHWCIVTVGKTTQTTWTWVLSKHMYWCLHKLYILVSSLKRTCVFLDCVYMSLSVDLQCSETELTNIHTHTHTLVEIKWEFKITRAVWLWVSYHAMDGSKIWNGLECKKTSIKSAHVTKKTTKQISHHEHITSMKESYAHSHPITTQTESPHYTNWFTTQPPLDSPYKDHWIHPTTT